MAKERKIKQEWTKPKDVNGIGGYKIRQKVDSKKLPINKIGVFAGKKMVKEFAVNELPQAIEWCKTN